MNTQIDLYLTEISIDLLGNKKYDINGKRQNKLIELFKAVPEQKDDNKWENPNDLMCSLGYDQGLTDDCFAISNFLEEQMDYTLLDANTSDEVNKSIITCLQDYKTDQDSLLKDLSEMHVKSKFGK